MLTKMGSCRRPPNLNKATAICIQPFVNSSIFNGQTAEITYQRLLHGYFQPFYQMSHMWSINAKPDGIQHNKPPVRETQRLQCMV